MLNNVDSGLNLTWYRAYDPAVGRWLSRDPLGEWSDPAANLYRYVGGNPVSWVDTAGLGPWDKLYGLPKDFWRWLHDYENGRLIKELKESNGQVSKKDAREWFDVWKNNDGSIDLSFALSMLVPLAMDILLSPSEIACGTGEQCQGQMPQTTAPCDD